MENAVTSTTYDLVDDRNPTGYAQVLEEQSTAAGTPTTRYVYGLRLIRQERPTTDWTHVTHDYFGHDGHGSVRLWLTRMVWLPTRTLMTRLVFWE
jgi:hypothetical protein